MDESVAVDLEHVGNSLDGEITIALGSPFPQRRIVVVALGQILSRTVTKIRATVEHIVVNRSDAVFDRREGKLVDLSRIVASLVGEFSADLREPAALQFRHGPEFFRLVLCAIFHGADDAAHVKTGIAIRCFEEMRPEEGIIAKHFISGFAGEEGNIDAAIE